MPHPEGASARRTAHEARPHALRGLPDAGAGLAQRGLRLPAFALFTAGMLLRAFADALRDGRILGAFRQWRLQPGDADLASPAIPAPEDRAEGLLRRVGEDLQRLRPEARSVRALAAVNLSAANDAPAPDRGAPRSEGELLQAAASKSKAKTIHLCSTASGAQASRSLLRSVPLSLKSSPLPERTGTRRQSQLLSGPLACAADEGSMASPPCSPPRRRLRTTSPGIASACRHAAGFSLASHRCRCRFAACPIPPAATDRESASCPDPLPLGQKMDAENPPMRRKQSSAKKTKKFGYFFHAERRRPPRIRRRRAAFRQSGEKGLRPGCALPALTLRAHPAAA